MGRFPFSERLHETIIEPADASAAVLGDLRLPRGLGGKGAQGGTRAWGFSPERPADLPTMKKAATESKPRCGLVRLRILAEAAAVPGGLDDAPMAHKTHHVFRFLFPGEETPKPAPTLLPGLTQATCTP